MQSKDLTEIDQTEMEMGKSPKSPQVNDAAIAAQPTLLAALNLMINISGLDDKHIYMTLDIDAGHWSRIRKGAPGANFPLDKLCALMNVCNSDIPLQWLAVRRGFELRPLLSSIEYRLEMERAARIRAEEKLATVVEFVKQTGGGRC